MSLLKKFFGTLMAVVLVFNNPIQNIYAMSQDGDFDNYRPHETDRRPNPIEKEYKFSGYGFEGKISREGSNLIVEILYKGGYKNNQVLIDGQKPRVLEGRTLPYIDEHGNEIFFGKPIRGIYYKLSYYAPKTRGYKVNVTTGPTNYTTTFII